MKSIEIINWLEKKKAKNTLSLDEKRLLRFEKNRELLKTQYNEKSLTDLQVRYLERGIEKIGYWDIETSDFNPLGNFIIGYCFEVRNILTGNIEKYEYHITKNDIKTAVENDTFNFDYKLLQYLSLCLKSVNVAIGHFSTKFDMPFFRTRCLLTKQFDLIPKYGELRQGDTWRFMKQSMKAPRNTLMNFALYTDTPNKKTHVAMNHWKRIYFSGNPKWDVSMKYIMDHCRSDVDMTRKAHMKVEKFNNIGAVLV